MKVVVAVWAFVIFILWIEHCRGAEIETASVYGGGWSIHSNATGMNETQQMAGGCINQVCFVRFLNSFGKRGTFCFYDFKMVDTDFLVLGNRVGFVWGYNRQEKVPNEISRALGHRDDPIFIPLMPYIGLGYKFAYVEYTYAPAPDGSHHYVAFSVIKINLYNKEW
jgi:hypothetical protein